MEAFKHFKQPDIFTGKTPTLTEMLSLIPKDLMKEEPAIQKLYLKYKNKKITQAEFLQWLLTKGFEEICEFKLQEKTNCSFTEPTACMTLDNFKKDKEFIQQHRGWLYLYYNVTQQILEKLGECYKACTWNEMRNAGSLAEGRGAGNGRWAGFIGLSIFTMVDKDGKDKPDLKLARHLIERLQKGDVIKIYAFPLPVTHVSSQIFEDTRDSVDARKQEESRLLKAQKIMTGKDITHSTNGS